MVCYVWSFVLVSINIVFALLMFAKRRRRRGEPPLVTHVIPFVGAALDFGKSPMNYLKNLQKRHGDVFTIKLAGWDVHVFMNPLDVRNLERTRHLDHTDIIGDFVSRMVGIPHSIHYKSGEKKDIEKKLAGSNVDFNNNDEKGNAAPSKLPHLIEKNLRGSMQLTSLCQSCKGVVVTAVRRSLRHHIEESPTKPIKLYDFCKVLVFDITFNLLFGSLPGIEDSTRETRMIYDVFKIYFKRSALLVDRIPIRFLPETKRARNELLKMMGDIVWTERVNVSQLITDIVDINPKLDFLDQRARHLLIVLWSAQANTAPALFWTLYYLLANPDAKRAVSAEFSEMDKKTRPFRRSTSRRSLHIDDNWPQMTNILNIERKDLDKMVILDGCLKETMRMTGSSMSLRKANKSTKIKTEGGNTFLIREGDYTTFFAPLTHMDPDIFDHPTEFVHDRFLCSGDEPSCCSSADSDHSNSSSSSKITGLLKSRSRFSKDGKRIAASRAIMTFGFGSTRCPGRHIAMIEIKLAVLALLQHFDLTLDTNDGKAPDFDLTHLGFGVMPPDRDVDIFVKMNEKQRV